MIRRRLALALALGLLPAAAAATDLMQTYELARAGDAQFSAAEYSRQATHENAVQARAAMLPQLGGSASLSRSKRDGSGVQVIGGNTFPSSDSSTETTVRDYGLTLNQMIYDRSRFTTLESRQLLSQASEFRLEAATDNLITRTSGAYFNVLVQLETLAAAEAAEAALKKQFDFASKRLEVGLAPITDVHEARAQYDSARANTIGVRTALADAYQALAEITGQPVSNLQGLPKDFQPQLPVSEGIDAWVNAAIDNNPALHAKQLQVQSAATDVKTARAARWPTLYLGARYGDSHNDGTTSDNIRDTVSDFANDSQSRSIGITLDVPIFAGGAIRSQVRQAIDLREIARAELEQQKRALERNARNAYRTLVAGISEVEARRSAVISARAAYEASQVGLEVGTRTVLDVLNNQQQLFQAQQAYALARYNYLQNRLLLEQAGGTLDAEDVQDVNRLLTVSTETRVESDIPQ